MNKIGLLGGTFDPFHNGHLSIAEAASKDLNLEYVYLLPAYVQPFKVGKGVTAKENRLDMLKLVAEEVDFLKVSTVELEQECISYTYDTIQHLKEENPGKEFVFIMGTDSLLTIEKWYKGEELLESCSFAVGLRPGHEQKTVEEKIDSLRKKYKTNIYVLKNQLKEISSTEIKERIRSGLGISELVPGPVERYIHEQKLYQ